MNKKGNKKQAEQQAGYFERYVTRIQDNLKISIKNIHIRLEDQKEQLIDSYSYKLDESAKKPVEKMCIGVTLMDLNLTTIEQTDQESSE